MTVQAYQTLYESSIAYGMRKALQAEQRKAEMLIKINQLNAICEDLEQTVADLKEVIWEKLEQEKAGLEAQQLEHEEAKRAQIEDNHKRKEEMKAKLLTTQL
jgi:dynein light intermediate chain